MTLTYHNNFCSFDIDSHPSETVIDCRFLNIQRQIFHIFITTDLQRCGIYEADYKEY